MRKIILFTALLLFTCLVFSAPTYAFNYSGYRWPDPAMGESYLINPNCTDPDVGTTQDIIDAIGAADREWENEGNAIFSFPYGGYTSATLPNDNNQGGPANGSNEIMFVQASQSYWYFVQNPTVIAVTWMWYNTQTNLIVECDMGFNDGNYVFSAAGSPAYNEMDVWNIAAHELGHYLCLNHSSVFNATMYGSASYGETKKRDLDPDDIAGIQYIYGAAANANPVLSNPIVDPGIGGLETVFSYYVDYYDANGGFSNARATINGVQNYMTLYSGTPANGTYVYSTTLNYVPNQEYGFYAEDGQGGSDIVPVLGYFTGPNLIPVTLALNCLTPTVPLGGQLRYDAIVGNQNTTTGYWLTGEANVILPSHQQYGPVLGPLNFNLPAGATLTYHARQTVPNNAPVGDYSYIVDISYSGIPLATESFPFTVTASDKAVGGADSWSGAWQE